MPGSRMGSLTERTALVATHRVPPARIQEREVINPAPCRR